MDQLKLTTIKALLPRVRVACAATIVEQVASKFPEPIRQSFYFRRAFDLAWRFATDGSYTTPIEEVDLLLRDLSAATVRAGDAGYPIEAVAMVALLVEEIKEQNGKSTLACIEYASIAYAAQHLFSQGTNLNNPEISDDYIERCMEVIIRTAQQVLHDAQEIRTSDLSHERFSAYQLTSPPRLPNLSATSKLDFPPPKGWAGDNESDG